MMQDGPSIYRTSHKKWKLLPFEREPFGGTIAEWTIWSVFHLCNLVDLKKKEELQGEKTHIIKKKGFANILVF